jgi:hypothetical protein
MITLLLILVVIVLAIYAWSQFTPNSLPSALLPSTRSKERRAAAPARSILAVTTQPLTPSSRGQIDRAAPNLAILRQQTIARVMVWARSSRTWLIVGTLALGGYVWDQFLRQNYDWSVVVVWIGAVCGFLALVAARPAHRLNVSRTEGILFGLVMVTGITLRLYRVDSVPFGLNHDAAYSGLIALKALHSPTYIPWSPDPTQGETFFDYWIVALIAVIGPVPLAIKGAAAAVGIVTLFGMYLFTRQLLGVRVAVIATFLLAISGWHLIFSRVGWRMITLPLVEVFAFYFLFRAIDRRKRGSFAMAGALLALQLDTYPAGRILPVLAVLWALIELWRGPDRLALLRGYALAVVSFLLAGASVLAFALTNPDAFNARYNSVNIVAQLLAGNWGPFWQNVQASIGLFTVRANGNDFFIDQPLLDPPARWLFVLGLTVAVWGTVRRSRHYAFVLLGLIMALLPGVISIAPNSNRGSGTMPFVYILAALPLVFVLEEAASWRRRLPAVTRFIPEAGVALLLISGLVGTFMQYLGPNRVELWGFYPETTVVGRYIRGIGGRYDAYLTDNYVRDALTYITYQPGDHQVGLESSGYPIQQHYTWQDSNQQFLTDLARPGRGLAFFMFADVPQNIAVLQQLRARYHNAVAFTLMYHDDNISRPASLVLLVPPPGATAGRDVPATAAPA